MACCRCSRMHGCFHWRITISLFLSAREPLSKTFTNNYKILALFGRWDNPAALQKQRQKCAVLSLIFLVKYISVRYAYQRLLSQSDFMKEHFPANMNDDFCLSQTPGQDGEEKLSSALRGTFMKRKMQRCQHTLSCNVTVKRLLQTNEAHISKKCS